MNYLSFIVLTKNTSNIPIFGPIWNLIVNILGCVMNVIYLLLDKVGIPNIGLAIILFTLVTRIIIFPTSLKQQKSSRMMQMMQPEIKAIQKKYENKTDNASMMAQQAEMKALYEKYGTSMTSGCLPLLLQMPIIFALYRIIMNIPAYVPSVKAIYENVLNAIGGADAASKLVEFGSNNSALTSTLKQLHNLGLDDPEKYGADKVANFIIDFLYKLNPTQWADLGNTFSNAADVINTAAAKSAEINSFLGLNLSTAPSAYGLVPNRYWLIPILAGIAQWASTMIMQKQQAPMSDGNDQSAQMMKSMNIMMPLMSVWFCYQFASGIGLYWIASSVFMLVQQLILNAIFSKKSNEEILQEAMEKANAKRAKKGLPPIDEKTVENRIKNIQSQADRAEQNRMEVIAKQSVKTKESTDYYNKNAKPGSLASKANMVKLYNEKNEKKNR